MENIGGRFLILKYPKSIFEISVIFLKHIYPLKKYYISIYNIFKI